MTIRKAQPHDAHAMASVAAAAYIDDSLFGEFMHPHLHDYPSDWAFGWERRFRASIADSLKECLVAIDDTSGKVVGVAEWERWSAGGKKTLKPRGLRMLASGLSLSSQVADVGKVCKAPISQF